MRPFTTARRGGRQRHTFGVTLAALAALVATSCSGSKSASVVSLAPGETAPKASAAKPTPAPAAATTATAATTIVGPVAPTAAPPAFNPVAVLAQALDTLAPAYDLATTVSNGDQLVQTISGRVVGTTSQLSLTKDTGTVEYLQVPPKAWVRDPGGDWSALDGDVPEQASLDLLRQPGQAVAVSEDASARRLHAVYPFAAFAIAGEGNVDVDIVVGTDNTVSITYPVTVGGKTLQVVEKLVPAPDAPPFTTP